jgi:hypothetical protein
MARADARRRARVDKLLEGLGTVYTPGRPIKDPGLFSGRSEILADLRLALPTGDKAAFVLYGERGVGKTSIWRVLLHDQHVEVHQASASDDFVSIFFRVLEHLGEQFTQAERERLSEFTVSAGIGNVANLEGKEGEETLEKAIAQRSLDLNFVVDGIQRRADAFDAIVIDEFHNISQRVVQDQIIEVVKAFADKEIRVKIFLVGVAGSDLDLIPNEDYRVHYKDRHFSVHRVTRMSDDEARDILEVRKRRYHVDIDPEVEDAIVRIAKGYPALTHRLALDASRAWANLDFTYSLLTGALSVVVGAVMPVAGSLMFSVKLAGVSVKSRDLRIAAGRYVSKFREDYPAVAHGYEALAPADQQRVKTIIASFESSPPTYVPLEQLTAETGIPLPEIETLLDDGRLVQRVDGACRLAVPMLPSFVEARRYLATSDGAGGDGSSTGASSV